MKRIFIYIFRDKVLLISSFIAVITMCFIPPQISYLSYMNWRVLIIMFSIMIAVAGFYETHFFDFVATKMVIHLKNIKWIALSLVWVTFFLAMLLTNDAVLLTLIPFTLFITKHTGQEKSAIYIIIFQTIAANMGSALTPMGDPQNIYLYQYYQLDFNAFLDVTKVITILGFLLVTLSVSLFIKSAHVTLNLAAPSVRFNKIGIFIIILMNVLFGILRFYSILYVMGVTLFLSLLFSRHLIKKVDYRLLFTFVFFFIITGNIAEMPFIAPLLRSITQSPQHVFFSGILLSQMISNVPAAILLSQFTHFDFWKELLMGVNVGALGTLIASLASLISFKYIINERPMDVKSYLIKYTFFSIIFMTLITLFILLV